MAKERALGTPDRPRFDHIGVTIDDLEATEATYAPFGFANIGVIHQPSDPRGFEINYLKGGDTVLEVFTFAAAKTLRAPQLDALGFVGVRLADSGADAGTAPAGKGALAENQSSGELVGVAADGRDVFADSDGLGFSPAR